MLDMKLTSCLCDAIQLPLVPRPSTNLATSQVGVHHSVRFDTCCSRGNVCGTRSKRTTDVASVTLPEYVKKCTFLGRFAGMVSKIFSPGKVGGRWPSPEQLINRSQQKGLPLLPPLRRLAQLCGSTQLSELSNTCI